MCKLSREKTLAKCLPFFLHIMFWRPMCLLFTFYKVAANYLFFSYTLGQVSKHMKEKAKQSGFIMSLTYEIIVS